MGEKGQDGGERVHAAALLQHGADHGQMAEVEAVERADGKHDVADAGSGKLGRRAAADHAGGVPVHAGGNGHGLRSPVPADCGFDFAPEESVCFPPGRYGAMSFTMSE